MHLCTLDHQPRAGGTLHDLIEHQLLVRPNRREIRHALGWAAEAAKGHTLVSPRATEILQLEPLP